MPSIQFKVPKFHLPAHHSDCHSWFSFNFTWGVDCTDGEGVEHNWLWLNSTAASTSQMGPGLWIDTLDNFMGFYNYQKIIKLGKLWCPCIAGYHLITSRQHTFTSACPCNPGGHHTSWSFCYFYNGFTGERSNRSFGMGGYGYCMGAGSHGKPKPVSYFQRK